MTNDEIKELAFKHGFTPRPTAENGWDLRPYVYDFAMALIAAEREACAKVCDSYATDKWDQYKGRGKYKEGPNPGRADPHIQGESYGADDCADAIRARSDN